MTPWRALAAVTAALVATAALTGCSGGGEKWSDRCDTTPDGIIQCAPDKRPAPPKISGELLDGTGYDIGTDRGKVVVVNFWGSWCAPCRAEAADLEAVHQATKGAGVAFLGVNVQDGRDAAKAFERGRVTYPSLFDPASRIALAFEVPPNSTPATVVLDRAGRIAVVIRQAVREPMLRPIVDRVAAEPTASS
ncbi:TlpA family protein disulfide reductase [Micromonospora zhanjiangensis]|uniref:TlpA family protein disulfide reductase n=1 Tax=Micromonospora zhanjiangensis TaxID=1522057 RepID=A0ABV8KRS9_9ACTN